MMKNMLLGMSIAVAPLTAAVFALVVYPHVEPPGMVTVSEVPCSMTVMRGQVWYAECASINGIGGIARIDERLRVQKIPLSGTTNTIASFKSRIYFLNADELTDQPYFGQLRSSGQVGKMRIGGPDDAFMGIAPIGDGEFVIGNGIGRTIELVKGSRASRVPVPKKIAPDIRDTDNLAGDCAGKAWFAKSSKTIASFDGTAWAQRVLDMSADGIACDGSLLAVYSKSARQLELLDTRSVWHRAVRLHARGELGAIHFDGQHRPCVLSDRDAEFDCMASDFSLRYCSLPVDGGAGDYVLVPGALWYSLNTRDFLFYMSHPAGAVVRVQWKGRPLWSRAISESGSPC